MTSTNHRFRYIHLRELDVLARILDCYRPSLKSDLQNVTYLLSLMIEDRCLPDQKLWLEMLTDEQIAYGELATYSVKELLNYTGKDPYSMYLELPPSPIEWSPSPRASLGEQSNHSTPFSGPDAPDPPHPENVDITISTIQEAFLSSPLKSPERESFTWSS